MERTNLDISIVAETAKNDTLHAAAMPTHSYNAASKRNHSRSHPLRTNLPRAIVLSCVCTFPVTEAFTGLKLTGSSRRNVFGLPLDYKQAEFAGGTSPCGKELSFAEERIAFTKLQGPSIGRTRNGIIDELGESTTAAELSVLAEVSLPPALTTLGEGLESRLRVPTDYIAETNLPTDIGHYRLRAYRIKEGARYENKYVGNEPCVIYSTDLPPGDVRNGQGDGRKRAVPIRIHDQCVTSEVFGSKRCDCKEQLKMSLKYIKENGGAVIYLQQEGRGIGFANKVAAYSLQDGGMDTVDANIHLGFPEDSRQYGVVPGILKDMGIDSIRLMTNNPYKIESLRALGVEVEGTIPMVVQDANPYNRHYLQTKVSRMNHTDVGDLLFSRVSTDEYQMLNGKMLSHRNAGPASLKNTLARASKVGKGLERDSIFQSLPEDLNETGVHRKEDGYCFGKESVLESIAAIKRGELVVVVDDEDRENEGDLIMASEMVTPELIARMVRHTSGVLCVAMEKERLKQLKVPSMVENNEDPKGTAFTISVDAAKKHGITTGISAADRATTINLLASPSSTADDFVRPGHIFPLKAREGGTVTRDGHTEASVDLARLAGLNPSGVLCEIVSEENPVEMARLPELKRFCKKHGFVMTSIVDIAQYRKETEDMTRTKR